MSKQPSDRPYEVGYGKTPVATRFGNRPQPVRKRQAKKSINKTVASILDQTAVVRRNGKATRVHPHEVQMTSLGQRALNGEIRAMKKFLKECDKARLLDQLPSPQTSGVVNIPAGMPNPVFDYLWEAFGHPPPWDEDICAEYIADYKRDKATIVRLVEEFERDRS